ncbi:hypothetical protein [Allochromatium palmeri]|uniref:Copper-binding protein n=1 Tax=Allochromatium palmeri TaxID=231048 RepID=A0A6N8EGX4_9GAMM|nr:hypothetical protein [Allochromatium palmeri]MTW21727.1 hypothetical protein [Allochromatium palmeri]
MKTLTRSTRLACVMTLSLMGLASVAHSETMPVAGGMISSSLTGTVTVVNVEKRMLTIETPDGHFEVLHVPKEVQRLDQIKIGNTLTITETELLLVDLQKGTDVTGLGVSTDSNIERDPGTKPSGMMTESLTIKGVITAMDKADSSVTIQGPQEQITLQVEDPSVLDSVAVGDGVSASYIRVISGEVTF